MRDSYKTPARSFSPGIGEAVANRTYSRTLEDGSMETWGDVAARVAMGNSLLAPFGERALEFHAMHHHLRQASLLMSGRHLQHGDETQPTRNMEVFTNCATAATTFLSFYLLLNGAGVGRSYDDEMILVDFNQMPVVIPVIDIQHNDVQSGEITFPDRQQTEHVYASRRQHYFRVPDTREGWAKAVEEIEILTFQKRYRDDVLIVDFSDVRPRGEKIGGMQGRPASGPGPLMVAIAKLASIRDAGMAPWRAAMYADHYMSECVLVGGARRSARMSTKTWRDKSVFDFIQVKKGGFLWSSNNSVTVDASFWYLVNDRLDSAEGIHARKVFDAICQHAYHDRTGEPGIINVDRLAWNDKGLEDLLDGDYAGSTRYQPETTTKNMLLTALARVFAASKDYKGITNPCGEIVLSKLGAYCVIADVVPFHAGCNLKQPSNCEEINGHDTLWDDDAEDAFRVATRALIRVNTMDSIYKKEVTRTNRIGVGITGLHEYAWARFGYGFKDMIDEDKSRDFWLTLSRFKRAVVDEASSYSYHLGVNVPHTNTTIKPSGSISKLFSLTEGAHLPSMREYLRWVQFRNDDPLVEQYRAQGYPIRKLDTYSNVTIVGFPTQPAICTLGMGDKLVTAGNATPQEQYQWLRLLEKYWIRGVAVDGVTALPESGNQISYTLKYKPNLVSYHDFKVAMREGQSGIRCCAVMPQIDTSAYEYQPEQSLDAEEFELLVRGIANVDKEDIGLEHVDCSAGGCPVDFGRQEAA